MSDNMYIVNLTSVKIEKWDDPHIGVVYGWKSFTSPEGQVFKDCNQSQFARDQGLSRNCISACLKGIQKTHKGWTFQYAQFPNGF